MLNDQLGRASGEAASGSGEKAEEDAEAYNKPKKKSRWAEPAPILPIKPWQVGENCQALYSGTLFVRTMSVFTPDILLCSPFQETARIMTLK